MGSLGVKNPIQVASQLARRATEPMAFGRVRPMLDLISSRTVAPDVCF